MQVIRDFFGNYVLISAVIAWAIAQFLKLFTAWFSNKKFNFKMIFANGGMPSSHSSTVMGMCTACAIQNGVISSSFAIALILAAIVMNDACGVRWETGEQAKILNRITEELFSDDPERINTGLKELVGHTPFQVLMGALLGIAVAIGYGLLLGKL